MKNISRMGWLLAALLVACNPSFDLYDLTCEGLSEPLAIDSAQPHFSWKIESRAPMAQSAYQIQLSFSPAKLKQSWLWDSGRVESADQIMVPYTGPALASRQQVWWRVRVWNEKGKASPWSRPQRLGIGVIGDDSLAGEYIGAVPGKGREPLLRKAFSLESIPASALLYVNSLGYHEAYLNGVKVSDAVLTPAVSQLD
jgi:alpha-L-rhamnosidase